MDNTGILSSTVMRAVQLVMLFSTTGYQLYLDLDSLFRYVSSGNDLSCFKGCWFRFLASDISQVDRRK